MGTAFSQPPGIPGAGLVRSCDSARRSPNRSATSRRKNVSWSAPAGFLKRPLAPRCRPAARAAARSLCRRGARQLLSVSGIDHRRYLGRHGADEVFVLRLRHPDQHRQRPICTGVQAGLVSRAPPVHTSMRKCTRDEVFGSSDVVGSGRFFAPLHKWNAAAVRSRIRTIQRNQALR